MSKADVWKLVVSIVVCLLAGVIGSIFTTPSIDNWYASLNKPVFNPPNWIFGPVWTTLYILMGVALWIVWRKGFSIRDVRVGMAYFGVQLTLNTLWSIIFFGLHLTLLAFLEIIVLWVAIMLTMVKFSRVSLYAVLLMFPYILWVSFAAFLNYSIWQLN